MDDVIAAIFCVALGGFFGAVIFSPSEAEAADAKAAKELRVACERELPRSQQCRMVFVPDPPK